MNKTSNLPAKDLLTPACKLGRREFLLLQYKILADGASGSSAILLAQKALAETSFEDKINLVYNKKGQYGGNQTSPLNKFQSWHTDKAAIEKIIKRYYPAADKEAQLKILRRLNQSACGFVAVVNGVFFHFAGRPEAFEKVFGIEMYRTIGSTILYNFDLLLVDFFLFAHKSLGPFAWLLSRGTVELTRCIFFGEYLKKRNFAHKVQMGFAFQRMETVALRKIMEAGGTAILSIKPCTFYSTNAGGEEQQHGSFSGKKMGHAVAVTGIKPNGDIIVSSWGKEFYIKAEEFGRYRWMHLQKMVFTFED